MRWAFKLIVPLWVFTCFVAFGQSHFAIDTDEYHYSATFDPARISKEKLRELLVFSPYDFGERWKIGQQQINTSMSATPQKLQKGVIPNSLELCVDADPRYLPCGKRDISDENFFANAQINLRINDEALAALNRVNVPDELQSILQQFQSSLSFYTTVERRRLEYLRTGDVAVLTQPIGNIDPSKECGAELRELKLATNLQRRYELSRYSWSNCLASVWNRTSRAYPNADWQSFLANYRITEKFSYKSVD